jgi:hypothetical protein
MSDHANALSLQDHLNEVLGITLEGNRPSMYAERLREGGQPETAHLADVIAACYELRNKWFDDYATDFRQLLERLTQGKVGVQQGLVLEEGRSPKAVFVFYTQLYWRVSGKYPKANRECRKLVDRLMRPLRRLVNMGDADAAYRYRNRPGRVELECEMYYLPLLMCYLERQTPSDPD